MRLQRLDLTRFGKFTDHSIEFGTVSAGSPDLHIVYGLNEAGKTTTFAAYLDLLFGMGEKNTFSFLHPYNTMQIGALLEFNGCQHEFVRLKQRTNSLLDGRGQPVNEAMLSSALGGIGRDAYRTMFSLDDQSLEEGGNAIIQSKGELGELLFSASTGLAGLSKSLVSASEQAGMIYRKRSSSTQLAELKKKLGSLKAERDAIDTFAAAYAALTFTHAQAEAAYGITMGELADCRTRHGELTRILGALPIAGELSRLMMELDGLGDLPRPPAEWFALLPELSRDETRLQALIESADRSIDRLASEISEIVLDDSIFVIASRIEQLDDGRARYRTAENDLPKRRIAVAGQDAVIAAILADLEQTGHLQPQTLLLPASLTGILRDLIETRSGVDAELAAAERELKRSNEALEHLRGEGETDFEETRILPPEAIALIEAALGRLSGSDLPSALAVEERAGARLRRTFDSQLAQLAPWVGDAETLRALRTAEPRQIEAWRAQAAAIDKRMSDHQTRLRDLVTERGLIKARIAALATEGPIDDSEARNFRRDRDAAWETHLGKLDLESARVFEQRMRQDDTLSSQRLMRSQDLAELRQLTQTLSAGAAAFERQEELLAEAKSENAVLLARISALLPSAMAAGPDASDQLSSLESWSNRRSQALAAWDALQEAENGIALLRADLTRHEAALASALELAGVVAVPTTDLTQTARDLLSRVTIQKNSQATYEKTLAGLERDLVERRRNRDEAKASADAWHRGWVDAVSKTWFADRVNSVAAIREMLKVLGALPAALREREQMAQRVATMERDQASFRHEISGVLAELGEPLDDRDPLESADALLSRRNAALRAQQMRADRQADLDEQIASRRLLEEQLSVHNARKAELTGFFDTDRLTAVAALLERVRVKERLEARAADLRDQITANLRATTYADAQRQLAEMDAADIERQAIELSARIEDLTERTRLLYAELTRAKDKLDAVVGDDAVARIEAQRRTIFLEIEDLAIRYLKLRTGTLAAEQALHIYREKHRSSMMNRASEAFRLITGGSYSGLQARPDKDKEILIGVSRDGGSKLATDMSTGTQFQLYLALRLAGYEEFAAVRPPVPFIADDIMESFDNPRSEEVFRLLGEMAKVGQVIYLTHHAHLCEIARNVVPGVRIHELP